MAKTSINLEIKDLVAVLPPKEVDQGALEERASKKRVFLMGSAAMDTEELLFRIMLLQWLDYEVVLEEAGINEEFEWAYTGEFMKTYFADLCSCNYVLATVNRIPTIVADAYHAIFDVTNICLLSYADLTEQVAKKVYDENFG